MKKQFCIENVKYAEPKPKVKKCTYTKALRALEKQLQQLYARRRVDVARDYKSGMPYVDIAEKYSMTAPTARTACYAADKKIPEIVEIYDRPLTNEERDLILGMEFCFTPGQSLSAHVSEYRRVRHSFGSMSVSLKATQ